MQDNKAPSEKRQAEKLGIAPAHSNSMPIPNYIRALLDRPIAFHPCLAELTGSLNAGLMLSQAVYWALRTKDPEGWFYKSQDDWYEEIFLNRREQENARQKLRCFSFWQETRRGVPATLHYRVDLDLLTEALSGKYADVTLEQVLTIYASTLKQLSKAGYMRARKAGVAFEFVDYAEVLRYCGMVCGICGKKITRPVGQKLGFLTFEHIIAIANGGSHTFKNLQPAHVECTARKNAGSSDSQSAYTKQTESAYTKQTSRLTQSKQVGLHKANKSAYRKQSLPYKAETTSETTSEKKQKRARANGSAAAASKFTEIEILEFLEKTKPHNAARNSGLAHKLWLTGEDDHLIARWKKLHAPAAAEPDRDFLVALELADNLLSAHSLDETERSYIPALIETLSTAPQHAAVVNQLKGLTP